MATLWNKGTQATDAVEDFTVGDDRKLDLKLARYDVQGSKAHIRMLCSIGLLSREEFGKLDEGLDRIARSIEDGTFRLEDDVEDIHSQVELLLTRELGDTGKKIHSGRSRNDQVLVDIKLFLRDELKAFREETLQLFGTLQELSDRYSEVLLPGYTHLQIAMPSSFGLWFGAYAEALVNDMYMLGAAYRVVNRNPLGSAAGYGNSFPLDREMTTRLLGFDSMDYNSVAAQLSRGKSEMCVASAIGALALTLNKFASDCCLYLCPNFGFISLCGNMPSGYHRDSQLLKDILFPALELMHSCLGMTRYMLSAVKVNTRILDNPMYGCMFTVEEVNLRTLAGTPFREAYRQVGQEVGRGEFRYSRGNPSGLTASELGHTHEGSLGRLCNDRIRELMTKASNW